MDRPLPLLERRFREGKGEQYLKNGKIRCQGLSKGQVRQWKEAHEMLDVPTNDIYDQLWPGCQCTKPALPGTFGCIRHGGRSPESVSPRSMLDVMPIDLAEKFKTISENPGYITLHDQINLTRALQWQLLEEQQMELGGEEAWDFVDDALSKLRGGDFTDAADMLERALESHAATKESVTQILKTQETLKNLTASEMKTVKELRLVATIDQIAAFVNLVQGAIIDGAEKYIDDPINQLKFLQRIQTAIGGFANIRPPTTIDLVGSGYREEE